MRLLALVRPLCLRISVPSGLIAAIARGKLPERQPNGSSRLKEARIVIESWCRYDNAVQPHASLRYPAPAPDVIVPLSTVRPAVHS